MNPAPAAWRTVSFVSGVHRIDARLHEPPGTPRGAAVIAHPHPAHGGTMDHPVVVCAAERATARGLLALRFDFRGVRQSEGDVSDAHGHLDDWRAAVRDVRRRAGPGFLLGGGFSYGARSLAAVLAEDATMRAELEAALLLAPATRVPRTRRDFGNLLLGRPLADAGVDTTALARLRALTPPTEILVGDGDVVAPPEELRAHLPVHAHLTVLAGLNHFFSEGRGAGPLARDAFVAAVDAALERLLPGG